MSQTSPVFDNHVAGYLVDSFVDCATIDLLAYAKLRGKEFNVKAIHSLVPSCHFSLNKTTLDDTPTYTVGICFNVTGLTLTTPNGVSLAHFQYANRGGQTHNHIIIAHLAPQDLT